MLLDKYVSKILSFYVTFYFQMQLSRYLQCTWKYIFEQQMVEKWMQILKSFYLTSFSFLFGLVIVSKLFFIWENFSELFSSLHLLSINPLRIFSSNFGWDIKGVNIVFASVRTSKLPSNNRCMPEVSIKSTVSLFASLKNKIIEEYKV